MSRQAKLLFLSVALGAAYGLLMRGLIQLGPNSKWSWPNAVNFAPWLFLVMSSAFVIVVPVAVGFLTVAVNARVQRVSILQRIFLPWIAVLLALLGTAAVAWEGSICLAMMAPIALFFGSVGGLVAGAFVQPSYRRAANISMAVVALLPFLVGPVEHHFPATRDIRSVESDVLIHASAQTIWTNIERVRRIDPDELPRSWNRSIGFPRPIEATLSHEGVGGVRHATFAGDVLFVETIDEWEPERRLGFSIRADTEHIPPTTLDEHVTVGGPYFDVLHGEYILEPDGGGATRLRLISRHRVSTDFNWYARLWTDAVMRDVQRSILYVIKGRCEAH